MLCIHAHPLAGTSRRHARKQCDIGCLPVVDNELAVVGVITDRDICMAGCSRDVPLRAIKVAEAMSPDAVCCRLDDPVEIAEAEMRRSQVRRLPVVSADGVLVGILSLNDIVRAAGPDNEVGDIEVRETLAAISQPR